MQKQIISLNRFGDSQDAESNYSGWLSYVSSQPTKFKTKLACTLEADESTRMRVGESLPNHHEDHFEGKGNNSLQHNNLVHKFILVPQTRKFLWQKQRWTKNGKNWRKFQRGTWRKSKVRNRWSMKQGRRALQFILHHQWTSVIWKMLKWRQNTRNTKVELCSAVIL